MKKAAIYIALAIVLSNMPVISEALSIAFYDTVGIPFHFITKDAHFYATGDINKISVSDSYKKYKRLFPRADHSLYRCFRKRNWEYFFLWRTFITNANWRAPYIPDPDFIWQYRGDYDLGLNETPRPYKWDDNSRQWIKVIR
jgi:hypothetical protein